MTFQATARLIKIKGCQIYEKANKKIPSYKSRKMSHGFQNSLSSILEQNLHYQQPASHTFCSQAFRPVKCSYQSDI